MVLAKSVRDVVRDVVCDVVCDMVRDGIMPDPREADCAFPSALFKPASSPTETPFLLSPLLSPFHQFHLSLTLLHHQLIQHFFHLQFEPSSHLLLDFQILGHQPDSTSPIDPNTTFIISTASFPRHHLNILSQFN